MNKKSKRLPLQIILISIISGCTTNVFESDADKFRRAVAEGNINYILVLADRGIGIGPGEDIESFKETVDKAAETLSKHYLEAYLEKSEEVGIDSFDSYCRRKMPNPPFNQLNTSGHCTSETRQVVAEIVSEKHLDNYLAETKEEEVALHSFDEYCRLQRSGFRNGRCTENTRQVVKNNEGEEEKSRERILNEDKEKNNKNGAKKDQAPSLINLYNIAKYQSVEKANNILDENDGNYSISSGILITGCTGYICTVDFPQVAPEMTGSGHSLDIIVKGINVEPGRGLYEFELIGFERYGYGAARGAVALFRNK